jgi:single-stranded-DNA-specific exonuclease
MRSHFDGNEEKAGWHVPFVPENDISAMSEDLEIDPIWARILLGRGFDHDNLQGIFLHPSPPGLSCVGDTRLASKRLASALKNQEKIAIYADLDVDGITSAAMCSRFLSRRRHPHSVLLVHREEGHGLNRERILALPGEGFRIILSADLGVSNIPLLMEARKKGLEPIVVDHHLIQEPWPEDLSLVHPQGRSCLTAVGCLYVLLREFVNEAEEREMAFLAGLAVLADRAPILAENRYFVQSLLDEAVLESFPGVKSLLRKKVQRKIMVNDFSFWVIPSLNAPGRMSDPLPAFRLLMAQTDSEAERYSGQVIEMNRRRREIEWSVYEEVRSRWDGTPVVFSPDWAPGVMGRIAHRLCEEFNRSVFVATLTATGSVRGSLRLKGEVTISDILKCLEGLPISGGGHPKAGGLGFPIEALEDVRALLTEFLKNRPAPQEEERVLDIDAFLPAYYRSGAFWEGLSKLIPFGEGFPEPMFGIRNAQVEKVASGNGRIVLCHFRWRHGTEKAAFRHTQTLPNPGDRLDLVMTPELVGKGDRVERHFTIRRYRNAG